MPFESHGECSGYLKGKAEITNALPLQYPVCKYCQVYLRYESAYDRYSCRITGEFLFDIKKHRGSLCPFKWEE